MYYYALNDYLKNKYGRKIYKIALDAGRTCPNRDGSCGSRGCIFCSGNGSGEFAADRNWPVSEQLQEAKARIQKKLPQGDVGYIAYFQAFTSTYGTVEELEPIFWMAIKDPEVVILSIATRPDCLPPDILDMLGRLNQYKPVWIELGLQTIWEDTAHYIRRGYELEVYDRAVKALTERNLEVITHVILGLPGESVEQMLETVEYVGRTGTQAGKFQVLEMKEYIDILEQCIRHLPRNMVIHRLTGDGDKRLLIAPQWSGNKRMVMNTIRREFTVRNVIQGSALSESGL